MRSGECVLVPQKVILKAFGMDAADVKEKAKDISAELSENNLTVKI